MKDSKQRTAFGIVDAIETIGQMAEDALSNAKSKEEYAFLFGHVNMAAALTYAVHHADEDSNIVKCEISLDYDNALNKYNQARKEHYEANQMHLEELFPELFKALDEIKAKLFKEKTTPKKKSKKEE